jgi:hypothetical protein
MAVLSFACLLKLGKVRKEFAIIIFATEREKLYKTKDKITTTTTFQNGVNSVYATSNKK